MRTLNKRINTRSRFRKITNIYVNTLEHIYSNLIWGSINLMESSTLHLSPAKHIHVNTHLRIKLRKSQRTRFTSINKIATATRSPLPPKAPKPRTQTVFQLNNLKKALQITGGIVVLRSFVKYMCSMLFVLLAKIKITKYDNIHRTNYPLFVVFLWIIYWNRITR